MTTFWKEFRHNKRNNGAAAMLSLVAGIFGIIAWASWLTWQKKMNADTSRTLPNTAQYGELEIGPSCSTAVSASVLLRPWTPYVVALPWH